MSPGRKTRSQVHDVHGDTTTSLADLMREVNDHAKREQRKQQPHLHGSATGGGVEKLQPKLLSKRGVNSSGASIASSMTATSVSRGAKKLNSGSQYSGVSMGSASVRRLEALKAELEQERAAKEQLQSQVENLSKMQDRLEAMLGMADIGNNTRPHLEASGQSQNAAGSQRASTRGVSPPQEDPQSKAPSEQQQQPKQQRSFHGFKVLSPNTY